MLPVAYDRGATGLAEDETGHTRAHDRAIDSVLSVGITGQVFHSSRDALAWVRVADRVTKVHEKSPGLEGQYRHSSQGKHNP